MATRILSRSFLTKLYHSSSSLSLSTTSTTPRLSLLHYRPISVAAVTALRQLRPVTGLRCLSTRTTSSSLSDPNPNWSNRPPKETILLDGCDFEHWLVVVEPPVGEPTRDEIIDSYIKTLSSVVGSEEEARKQIYSVSTRCYFAFGALVSEELSYKLKELPNVRWVLPDSYLDVRNKDYGGEPFINGQAVPYDPKYHEEWIKNHSRSMERNNRNDRPRNADRSRNFERRRENMQNRDFQNRGPPPNSPPNMGNPPPNMAGPPPNMGNPPPNMGGPPPNMGGPPPNMSNPPPNMSNPPPNMGGPPSNMGGPPPNMGRMPPNMGPPNVGGGMPPNNGGGFTPNYGMPPNNMGRSPPPPPPYTGGPPPPPYTGGPPPPNNFGGMPPSNFPNNYQNIGNAMPPINSGGNQGGNFQNYQNNGGPPPPQGGQVPNRDYPNNYGANMGGPYQR